MKNFQPDYNNILNAAFNLESKRTPLYEHGISFNIMEEISGVKFAHLINSPNTLDEFFYHHNAFYKDNGYDTVTFEGCLTAALVGGGALGSHVDPIIKTREDFIKYPFDSILDRYVSIFKPIFDALLRNMPDGMKAIGGVGNGVFETVQDLTSYQSLMLLSYDDSDLYEELYSKVGDIIAKVWEWFLGEYQNGFCVLRFGDDLGYKSNTLLPHDHIRDYIVPQYKRIVSLVHHTNKPFLLHSCGCIFDVMEDIIDVAKINAKHSNEDVIADFDVWVDRYGDRIGNFGGVDTDFLCKGAGKSIEAIKEKVTKLYNRNSKGHGGFALGSGNSIPDYVDKDKYLAMVNTLRQLRGDCD